MNPKKNQLNLMMNPTNDENEPTGFDSQVVENLDPDLLRILEDYNFDEA